MEKSILYQQLGRDNERENFKEHLINDFI